MGYMTSVKYFQQSSVFPQKGNQPLIKGTVVSLLSICSNAYSQACWRDPHPFDLGLTGIIFCVE